MITELTLIDPSSIDINSKINTYAKVDALNM